MLKGFFSLNIYFEMKSSYVVRLARKGVEMGRSTRIVGG